MKNNDSTSLIIFLGIFILCVFTSVAVINILPNINESDSYYGKVENNMSAKIESLYFEDDRLNIITSGNPVEFCVKSTKSTPENNNICWKEIEDNKGTISIYQNKKYYVWIKDENNNVSSPMSINTRIDN